MAREDVALDIGHGTNTWERGGGKGVKKNGVVYEEHTANSDVAVRVKKILEAHGLTVWMPQQPMSTERALRSRTDEANRRGVKLYWSIHFNAGTASTRGVCAFYWHTNSKTKQLAAQFAANARAAGMETHGAGTHASIPGTWTDLHVVRETRGIPAILTENGFMTNASDFIGIFGSQKDSYRQLVAEVNAKTILGFFGIKYEPKRVGDIIPAAAASSKPWDVRLGDKNARVGELQEDLKTLGYYKGAIDDSFGYGTEAALKAFQKKAGLADDGIFGPGSQSAMDKAVQAAAKAIEAIKYPMGVKDRKGEVRLKTDMNYRTAPSLDAPVMHVLPKGHTCHYYDIQGDWMRLGAGWVSNKGGKYVEITKRYITKKEPAKTIHRVKVNGEQIGAYSVDENAIQAARDAIKKGAKNIQIIEK